MNKYKRLALLALAVSCGIFCARAADERYKAEVPDTLDLAERAALALNALTSCVDPDDHYNMYFLTRLTGDPYMIHMDIGDFICCQPKWLEGIPLCRAMSGSEENLEMDPKIVGGTLGLISGDDGLFYLPPVDLSKKPWYKRGNYTVINEPVTTPFGNCRLMLAMMAWYGVDHQPVWLDRLKKATQGMRKIAIFKDDYAYYPEGKVGMEFAYLQKTGYKYTEEPKGEHEGGEGSVLCYEGPPIRALSRWYAQSGDKDALDLAAKLTRFVMKPKLWELEAPESKWTYSQDHGHFDGHHHGTAMAVRGLLEYGHVANDQNVKLFARDVYEWERCKGLGRIGNFGDHSWGAQVEGCTIADMVALAIRLSDYGVGDYWDDADRYIRNHLVESQFTDLELMKKVAQAAKDYPEAYKDYKLGAGLGRGPDQWRAWDKSGQKHETRDVFTRNVGNFGAFIATTTIPYPGTSGCCIGNLAPALYYAWESIARCKDGNAQVNLLLNRASPWLDVLSYLPYEGKVQIKNKTAKRLSIRIPGWVDKNAVQCDVNGAKQTLNWTGNYIVLGHLEPKAVVTVTFPMVTETIKLTMPMDKQYTLTFKGNTLIDVSPRDTNPTGYPIYQRDAMKGDKVAMVEKEMYVTDALPEW